MATTQQRKLQKRKAREEKNKKAKLHRQAVATKKRQEENAEFKKLKRIKKLQRDMGNLSVWADDVLMKLNDKALTQLEKNAQILKALEAEYAKEKDRKRELNDGLEAEGLKTLEQKMNALHNRLVEQQKAAGEEALAEERALAEGRTAEVDMGVGGAAECRFTVNKPAVDVAEVSVSKAPGFDLKENPTDS
jgi:hypothetical protein